MVLIGDWDRLQRHFVPISVNEQLQGEKENGVVHTDD
jgi:hypothetical protein